MSNDIDALVNELLTDPTEVAILAGAGLSIPPPTCLPSGAALSEAMLKAVSDDFVNQIQSLATAKVILAQELKLYVGKPIVNRLPGKGTPLPRPETIFQAYQSVAGKQIVESLLIMRDAFPNQMHSVIGVLCERGSAVVTTNFDRLIEGCSNGRDVLHLHGHIGDLASISTTVETITEPLSKEFVDQLEGHLRGKRVLVVLGYSGSDTFDIAPALKNVAKKLGLSLIWVQHGGVGTPLDRGAHRQLSDWPCTRRAIICKTDELARKLAGQIGGKPVGIPDERQNGWWLEGFLGVCPSNRL